MMSILSRAISVGYLRMSCMIRLSLMLLIRLLSEGVYLSVYLFIYYTSSHNSSSAQNDLTISLGDVNEPGFVGAC